MPTEPTHATDEKILCYEVYNNNVVKTLEEINSFRYHKRKKNNNHIFLNIWQDSELHEQAFSYTLRGIPWGLWHWQIHTLGGTEVRGLLSSTCFCLMGLSFDPKLSGHLESLPQTCHNLIPGISLLTFSLLPHGKGRGETLGTRLDLLMHESGIDMTKFQVHQIGDISFG